MGPGFVPVQFLLRYLFDTVLIPLLSDRICERSVGEGLRNINSNELRLQDMPADKM